MFVSIFERVGTGGFKKNVYSQISEATKKSGSVSCFDEGCEHPLVFKMHTFASVIMKKINDN